MIKLSKAAKEPGVTKMTLWNWMLGNGLVLIVVQYMIET